MSRHEFISGQILSLVVSGVLFLVNHDSRSPQIWTRRPRKPERQIRIREMIKTTRRQPRPYTEIRITPKTKVTIGYARLAWIIANQDSIPDSYEVHHLDEDWTNNATDNLVLLHPKDHNKMHKHYADEVF